MISAIEMAPTHVKEEIRARYQKEEAARKPAPLEMDEEKSSRRHRAGGGHQNVWKDWNYLMKK